MTCMFQQIPFKNNYSITNTNNKGSATRNRSSLHKVPTSLTLDNFLLTNLQQAQHPTGMVLCIKSITLYIILSTHILYKVLIL